jgi:hypothetical protein
MNGEDDDGDSQVDCLDPDCAENAACPDVCGDAPDFGIVACRLAVLRVRTGVVVDGAEFLARVDGTLGKASDGLTEALAKCLGREPKAARGLLRKVGKRLATYRSQVTSRAGRRAVPEKPRRERLVEDVQRLRELVRALRRLLDCPAPG